MKRKIGEIIYKVSKSNISKDDIIKCLEVPPNDEMGDYALPCFKLANTFKQSPTIIAENLYKQILNEKTPILDKVVNIGGYLNFYLDKNFYSNFMFSKLNDLIEARKATKKIKIVEFASPNTNKPLHLGHLRNLSIGESISRIYEFSGDKVFRVNLNNDRGIHICKSMLAYMKYGGNQTPENSNIKSDHFVGDYYVLFNEKSKTDKNLENEARELLKAWESENEEVHKIWKKMNEWALEGFKETYKKFGISFDKEYHESGIYKTGKKIIKDGLQKKVFYKKNDGAIAVDLEKENLGEKIVLRADGTSIYITQDLSLVKIKNKDFHPDESIYVVGNEQNYHFRVLETITKKLFDQDKCIIKHLSYGMVELPDGKMKSREGNVIDADDFIEELEKISKEYLKERWDLNEMELNTRSHKIALAAIKYNLLCSDIEKNMIFNSSKAIKFEGETGPYLLYSYARASSILNKTNDPLFTGNIIDVTASELELIKKMYEFKKVISFVCDSAAISSLAKYGFELAKKFNEFYNKTPVLKSSRQQFRVQLVRYFSKIIHTVLYLLGIEAIEKM